jgi:hypothetical protein
MSVVCEVELVIARHFAKNAVYLGNSVRTKRVAKFLSVAACRRGYFCRRVEIAGRRIILVG